LQCLGKQRCMLAHCEHYLVGFTSLCSKHRLRFLAHGAYELPKRAEPQCEHCHRTYKSNTKNIRFCSRKCHYDFKLDRSPSFFVCVQCGVQSYRRLSGRNAKLGYRNKFCSAECRKQHDSANTTAPKCNHFARYCTVCMTAFATRYESKTQCIACVAKLSADRSRKRYQQKTAATIETTTCKECEVQFTRLNGKKLFCSLKCTTRHHKRIHRAKRRSLLKNTAAELENVNPFVVFTRDKWTCYICGVHTPRKLRGSYEDNAPELEHIVPLSRGGLHTYGNTACACRKCNHKKSTRFGSDINTTH